MKKPSGSRVIRGMKHSLKGVIIDLFVIGFGYGREIVKIYWEMVNIDL